MTNWHRGSIPHWQQHSAPPIICKRLAEPPRQGSAYGLTELIAREGQEFINAFVGPGGQLLDDIGEPCCRIELITLGRREQTLNRCGAFVRAGNNGAATRFDKSPERSTARPDGAPAKPSGRPRCYHLRGAPQWFARLNDRDDI